MINKQSKGLSGVFIRNKMCFAETLSLIVNNYEKENQTLLANHSKNGGTNDMMLTMRIKEMIMNSYQSLC